MRKNVVLVGKVVDEFGEFFIGRELSKIKEKEEFPESITKNFTGKELKENVKNLKLYGSIKISRQNYYIFKKKKELKK